MTMRGSPSPAGDPTMVVASAELLDSVCALARTRDVRRVVVRTEAGEPLFEVGREPEGTCEGAPVRIALDALARRSTRYRLDVERAGVGS